MENDKNYKLCLVYNGYAYFTTQKLEDQWGDDWNDAPYEHNAGEPYYHRPSDGGESWDIIKVAFEVDALVEPSYGSFNSEYSVQSINKGNIPWLRCWQPYLNNKDIEPVYAGSSIREFVRKVEKAYGTVYFPRDFDFSLVDEYEE